MSKSRSDLSKMTYLEFDQYMRSGKGGKGEQAALLLIHYLSDAKNLTNSEKCLLHWHAGQDYAKAGKNDLAIHQFNLASEEKETMSKTFGPTANAYYKATIAFLKKDKETIGKHLQEILAIPMKDYPPLSNLVLLAGRVHDMYEHPEYTYDQIFAMNASMPPTSDKKNWHLIKASGKPGEDPIQAYRDILEKDLKVAGAALSSHSLFHKETKDSKKKTKTEEVPHKRKDKGIDVSNDQMADSAFGQSSNTARKFRK
ncbi:hypothetical protein AYO45_00620 [Gammaproteobacteria bacterium SCGC AG-212-F23]|nr:hypothetical protein AYO45_00620 [Gammaproteobacteria bacterium SCGC AG-212-F23]